MNGFVKFLLALGLLAAVIWNFREKIPGLASEEADGASGGAGVVDDGRSSQRATEASQTSELSRRTAVNDARQGGMAATAQANRKRRESEEAMRGIENEGAEDGDGDQ